MRRLAFIAAGVLVPLAALAASSAPIGYAQSTGYYKKETRPTLYQPLNLLDGREVSVWCTSGGDPLNDKLFFGFKGPATIDEVRVYTGNGSDDASFQEFSRAKKFSIKSSHGARSFTVADQRGLQSVSLQPPLSGTNFTLEILDLYPAEDPDSPVCVTDIVFYSHGKPLNGPWLTQKLKYDKQRAPVLGTWYSGYVGAPERFLSLFFDKTYRLDYEPIDTAKKVRAFTGEYEVYGSRVTLTVPGKGKFTGKLSRRTDEGGGRTLTFEGAAPEDLKEAFRDQP